MGNLIRQKLMNYGLNLNSQQRNVYLAKLAKTFKFATVDLANASNTLAVNTVRALLPSDWFNVLYGYRSKYGKFNQLDRTYEYEMFSSMGNGFTFELESLIFYALCIACVRHEYKCSTFTAKRNVAVYGDDLIVPQAAFSTLVETLDFFGFSVNKDKSYTHGKFFESCGSDFFEGTDVRPFFLKRELKQVKDVYYFCNSVLFKCIKSKSDFLFPAYLTALKSILDRSLVFGPLHFYEGKDGWAETYDDLEALLRVPLEFAQANGGVTFDTTLFAWSYKKWIRVAIEIPLGKNNSDYFVQNMKYLTFLRGNREGKVVYKGRTKFKLVRRFSSNWNGSLTRRDLYLIGELFRSDALERPS
jgi:hypothetical protein